MLLDQLIEQLARIRDMVGGSSPVILTTEEADHHGFGFFVWHSQGTIGISLDATEADGSSNVNPEKIKELKEVQGLFSERKERQDRFRASLNEMLNDPRR